MSSSVKSLVLAALLLPVPALGAQDVPTVGAPVSRSLLLREAAVAAMLPLGDGGALTVGLSAFGTVTARSGDFPQSPRSQTEAQVEVGYLRLGAEDQRVRPYRVVRLSYGVLRYAPEPKALAHSIGAYVGIGAMAQLTQRVGLIADVGPRYRVRRHSPVTPSFIVPGSTMRNTETVSTWATATFIGVTLRAKPRAPSAP